MTAVQLLSQLGAAGINVWLDKESQLRFKAPKGALTPELREQLITSKDDVIQLLLEMNRQENHKIKKISRKAGHKIPLSFSQQRLWFLDRLDPGNPSFHIATALRISGDLDINILRLVFEELVSRHESLRTTFLFKDNEVSQVIKEPFEWLLAENYDLSGLDSTEQENRVQEIAVEETLRSFDLTQGADSPYRRVRLLRTRLARLTEEDAFKKEHVLFITLHHIIADGWSMEILVNELSSLYEAFSKNQSSPLPELTIQYVDYACAQRDFLTGERYQKHLQFWRGQLEGNTNLDLPIDYPRPPKLGSNGASVKFALDDSLASSLKSIAKANNTTLFVLLLSAFKTLLFRYTQQEDICIGTPVANRNNSEIEPLIGCFVNLLALRTQLSNTTSFKQLMLDVHESMLSAVKHQEFPFECVVEELEVKRDMSRTPIFQVVFSLQNSRIEEGLKLTGLNIEHIELDSHTAKYDLQLHITDEQSFLTGIIEYNADLFSTGTIERMSEHFQQLLQSISENPDSELNALTFILDNEKQLLLNEWNKTVTDYPEKTLTHELFEQQVSRTPNATAACFYDKQLSYAQLNDRANQIARYLQQQGARSGDLIGICLERSLDMLASLLAVLKTGCAYVPIDPEYPQERIQYVAEAAKLSVLLTQTSLKHRIANSDNITVCHLDTDSSVIDSCSSDNLSIPPVDTKPMAYTIFTSGSTGNPKGVAIPHSAFVNFLMAMQAQISLNDKDALLAVTTISFDIAGLELFLPLLVGAKTVICSRDDAMNADAIANLIEQHQISIMQATPATWRMMLASEWRVENQSKPPIKILCGGEPLPPKLANQLLDRHVTLYNVYGPTETTVWSTIYPVESRVENHTVSIGRPLANTSIFILDETMKPVPIGTTGRLWIGGAGLAFGYLGQRDLTDTVFVDNPFKEIDPNHSEKIYNTGDLARYLSDGRLECIGRADTQVKIRGFRIELGEIETHLNKHSKIAESVVNPVIKDELPYLVAYIEPKNALVAPAVDELQSLLRSLLPDYMVPSAYVFLDALPLTPNGKVDRKALPEPEGLLQTSSEYIQPRTLNESLLVDIWSETLRIEKIGVLDNFFELGGHSLMATELTSKMAQAFGSEIPLRILFENPTIELIAKYLESGQQLDIAVNAPAIEPANTESDLPMSFAQERLWIIDQISPDSHAYNIPAALRLKGEINEDALARTFEEIVHRHEALRTVFSTDTAGNPIQIIKAPESFSISIENLCSSVNASNKQEIIQSLFQEESGFEFSLTEGPLFRVRLIRLDQQERILLINMHHIISDGWSLKLLQQEIEIIYTALIAGKEHSLQPITIQYSDFAYWQHKWLQDTVLQQYLDYWKNTLKDCPKCITLPYDKPRPATQTFNGKTYKLHLSKGLSQQLQKFSGSRGVTLYTTLLTAYALMLSRYSGQQDVCIGTPIAGRNRDEIKGLIGYFVNTVVIRTQFSGNPTVEELITRVKSAVLGAFSHQDIPIERVLEALELERNPAYPPVAQVGFNYIGSPISKVLTSLGDADIEQIEVEQIVAKYDLVLAAIESEEGIEFVAEYNTDLFVESTVAKMMGHVVRILEQFMEQPTDYINALPMHSPQELFAVTNTATEDYSAILPLTPIQRDLYLTSQLRPETKSNNLGYSIHIQQAIDLKTLEKAAQWISDQSDLLRTEIIESQLLYGDIAYQCIARNKVVNIEYFDFQNEAEKDIHSKIDEIIYRPYSPDEKQFIRYALIQYDSEAYYFVFATHHALNDGISINSHAQLLMQVYESLANNNKSVHPPLNNQIFNDYTQILLSEMDSDEVISYWSEKLAECNPLSFFVETRGQTEQQVYKELSIADEQWLAIKKYCRKQRITPAILFRSIYALLISQYCRATGNFSVLDFTDDRREMDPLAFGCYFQQTPMIFDSALLQAESTISELFRHARDRQREIKHKRLLSPKAQQELQTADSLQFMFNYYHFYDVSATLNGHEVEGKEFAPLVENAIQFIAKEEASGLGLQLTYSNHNFTDFDFLERIEGVISQLIAGVTQLNDLNIVFEHEWANQVRRWNNTAKPLPPFISVKQAFESQVTLTPKNIAVIDDNVSLTYDQLNANANRLAHYLHHLGVGADTRVAILMNRSASALTAILATIKAGGAYVPVDPKYPVDRIEFILKDSHAAVLLTVEEYSPQVGNYDGTVVQLDGHEKTALAKQSETNLPNSTDLDDLLYVIYTSGSTGQPKGAGICHQSELNLLQWYTQEFDINESTTNLIISALGFDLTQKNIFAPLMTGGRIILPELAHYDSQLVANLIDEHKATFINCAPSAFYPLAESYTDVDKLASLQYVIFGGEPIRLERLKNWISSPYFNAEIVNNYGPTECTDIAAFHRIKRPEQQIGREIPLGRPNDNVQLFVLNDQCQLLPTGLIGELCIAGVGVGRGYLNNDELNREKFVSNPFGNGQMYRTGDLVRYSHDGVLHFIGRKDFQVKINGLRIELSEIEHAVRGLDYVIDTLVMVHDDQIIAYVTSDNTDIDWKPWQETLRQQLPQYMVPKLFMVLDSWPLSPNGKIDRKALPSPDSIEQQSSREYVAPRTETEQKLAEILQTVLGEQSVGVYDDFFEVGGNSLVASRAIVQIREKFAIDIPLNILFEMTNIDKLAEYIDTTSWAAKASDSTEDNANRDEGFI